jgi:aminocarboxymuconate-semialdehyde decarboxylase
VDEAIGVIVDVHAHIIVPEITRGAGDEPWRPDVRWEDGAQVVGLRGRSISSAVGEFVRIERILEQERSRGIDGVVLSPWVALLPAAGELEESLKICRIQNDALASIAARHVGRVWGFGAVPMQDPEAAAVEVERLVARPGMVGVEMAASIAGTYLGDDRFLPVWEAAERSRAIVFVHPTTRGFDLPVFEQRYLWNTVGNPMETAVTAAHLVTAGVLERYPDLRVVLAHGGGALPSVRGRLDRAYAVQSAARERLDGPPEESMRRLFVDTVTHDRELLRGVIGWLGAGKLLLGSDHPFDMGSEHPVDDVRALGLPAAEEAAISGGTLGSLIEAVSGARER